MSPETKFPAKKSKCLRRPFSDFYLRQYAFYLQYVSRDLQCLRRHCRSHSSILSPYCHFYVSKKSYLMSPKILKNLSGHTDLHWPTLPTHGHSNHWPFLLAEVHTWLSSVFQILLSFLHLGLSIQSSLLSLSFLTSRSCLVFGLW